ncbi:MAG: ribose 5-phosphate isomerase B [Bacteroidia bacterium]
MKIAIASDHAGYDMKEHVKQELQKKGIEVKDFGTHSKNSVDYPDFVHPVVTSIQKGEFEQGILLCGSGNGMVMAANRHSNIRAALCWTGELSRLAREHNNANVLCIPARFIDTNTADTMVEEFVNTPFEGGRHQTRVDKIEIGQAC